MHMCTEILLAECLQQPRNVGMMFLQILSSTANKLPSGYTSPLLNFNEIMVWHLVYAPPSSDVFMHVHMCLV